MTNKKIENSPNDDVKAQELPYFAQLLPWHQRAWLQFVEQFKAHRLPHGLFATGIKGVGKREFVWRAIAYQLCHRPSKEGACGMCESCHWLQTGTHPDLMVLPESAMPTHEFDEPTNIKVDDIRELQHFAQLQSQGARVVVLDGVESLTIGAANALLKTLEEPRDGVFIWLISDHTTQVMPTIRSRVQVLPLSLIEHDVAVNYLRHDLVSKNLSLSETEILQLLTLADGAVLYAADLAKSKWYPLRKNWLQTFKALQLHTRTPMQAMDYWQKTLNYKDFAKLSRMMINELYRVGLGLTSLHVDIDVSGLMADVSLSDKKLSGMDSCLNENEQAISQNVQEKLVYDRLIMMMAS